MTTITLPPLPYDYDALEPHISKETLEFHHDKHHNTYVVNLVKSIEGTDLEGKELDDIIKATAGDASKAGIFNNAAQVWNHTFYWNCMTKNGGGKATGPVAEKIDAAFGSYEKFAEEFATAATTQFGSGWAWLVADEVNGNLSIMKTSNADTPLAHGKVAILTIDVWEHAYYIDYRNARPKYISTFLESLVNWEYVNAKLAGQPAGVEK
ncbi:superoxide dismutase [Acinetobacter sp. 230853]|uniref:superoxide dismutase n=1 Tax=Acinetobacter sp. 230853 TaxID=1310651 RepID=UPI000446DAF7|nr:superoxide dismutase [Acinetobacter sp. 230853]EXB73910.1 superoxide dismutase [Acinetobacter sp. 230853]